MRVTVDSLLGRRYGCTLCSILGLEANDTADIDLLPWRAAAWVFDSPRRLTDDGENAAGRTVRVWGWRPLCAWVFVQPMRPRAFWSEVAWWRR